MIEYIDQSHYLQRKRNAIKDPWSWRKCATQIKHHMGQVTDVQDLNMTISLSNIYANNGIPSLPICGHTSQIMVHQIAAHAQARKSKLTESSLELKCSWYLTAKSHISLLEPETLVLYAIPYSFMISGRAGAIMELPNVARKVWNETCGQKL